MDDGSLIGEPDLRIRAMNEADLDQVLAIETVAFANPWTRDNFVHELRENPHAINRVVQDRHGRVVAYVAGWRIVPELKVNNVAVHQDWRRREIAARALRFLFAEARRAGCRVATLEVRMSNSAALALYRRLGFHEDGRRKNYYPTDNEDAVLMSRAL